MLGGGYVLERADVCTDKGEVCGHTVDCSRKGSGLTIEFGEGSLEGIRAWNAR